jgi:DNA modification methylase
VSGALLQGDARYLPLADASVQCVVTSPPYWGLRDYGLPASVWDAADQCAHAWGDIVARANTHKNVGFGERQAQNGQRWSATNPVEIEQDKPVSLGAFCRHCPAWRGVLGLEPTPELYVQHLVECFREIRRVLRDDGVVWLNLADTYASNGSGSWGSSDKSTLTTGSRYGAWAPGKTIGVTPDRHSGLKAKDLVGIPWRVAFALQADGWYLRADVIWAKPNPMPESVTDRPTKAHEYVFLLAKSLTYFYDGEAVREPADYGRREWTGRLVSGVQNGDGHRSSIGTTKGGDPLTGRNRRSVWTIGTEPYPEAHFATFPQALVIPCVLAGTSEAGACAQCGAPWERVVARTGGTIGYSWNNHANDLARGKRMGEFRGASDAERAANDGSYRRETTGRRPTCACGTAATRPSVVLDPFAGSGTVGEVAERLGRDWVCVDLSAPYGQLARLRTRQRGLRWHAAVNGNGTGHHAQPVQIAGWL